MGKKVPERKVSMLLPYTMMDTFNLLSDEDCGKLIKAMMAYEVDGEEPEFEQGSSLFFAWHSNVKNMIDHNKEKYEAVIEARRNAGRKGGLSKADNQKGGNVANAKKTVANNEFATKNVANKNKSYPQAEESYIQEENQSVYNSSVANATFAKNNVANATFANQKDSKAKKTVAKSSDHDHDHDHDKNHPSISTTVEDNTEVVGAKSPAPPVQEKNADTSSGSLDGWMDKYKLKSKDAWDAFWGSYPRKQGSINEVKSAFLQLTVQGVAPGDLICAAERYAREIAEKRTDAKYIKMPLNFLQQGVWRSYIPRYLPSCPYCHGQGVYKDGDAMRMCSCDTRYKGVKA